MPHRAHVLRPHRRDARDDPGRRRRRTARRRWPSCCRSSGTTSTGIFQAMKGTPVTIRTARPAAARVPAARRQGPGGDGQGDGRLEARRSPSASRSCTSSTRCSASAAAGWASSIRRSPRCRPGPSSRRPATCRRQGIEVEPEVMIPLVGFLTELKAQAKIVRDTAEKVFAEKGVKVDVPGRHDDRAAARLRARPTRSPRRPSSSASAPTT